MKAASYRISMLATYYSYIVLLTRYYIAMASLRQITVKTNFSCEAGKHFNFGKKLYSTVNESNATFLLNFCVISLPEYSAGIQQTS